jgi:hypothetical protein
MGSPANEVRVEEGTDLDQSPPPVHRESIRLTLREIEHQFQVGRIDVGIGEDDGQHIQVQNSRTVPAGHGATRSPEAWARAT